jgi:hypothetical protein
MSYVVMVDDNFHYMDESERYRLGKFDDAEVALGECRRIVNDYLLAAYKPGMSARELYDSYKMFGEDPYVCCVDVPQVRFSAWDYARNQSVLLCVIKGTPSTEAT